MMNIGTSFEHVATELETVKAKIEALERLWAESEVTEEKETLMSRLEDAIRAKPSNLNELSKALSETTAKVAAALKAARTTGRLRNIETTDLPVWMWRPGPESTAKEIRAIVLGLITYQPMTFVQLKAATGLADSTLQNALTELKRTVKEIVNMGTAYKARYFVLPDSHREPEPATETEVQVH